MDRRAVVFALVLVTASAGCSGVTPGDGCGWSYTEEFTVVGYPVSDAPENATVVPATDDRIDRVDPVQRVIRLALESGNNTALQVNETEFRRVRDALDRTPLYENTHVIRITTGPNSSSTVTMSASKYVNPEGLYVEARGRIVRVSYQSWCSER